MEKEVAKYNHCFVCGQQNPIGLKLRFITEGDQVVTTFKPEAVHEGYKNIAHGGLVATILDEVMIKAALAKGIFCVTAQMEIRYKKPVLVGAELQFVGSISEQKGRLVRTVGLVRDGQGNIYAEATATYMVTKPEMTAKLQESLEQ